MSSLPDKKPTPSRPRRRKLAFRLLAVFVGLSPLLITEGLCRVFDWGRPELQDDPFVGFSGVQPLFVRQAKGDRFEISPARRRFFCQDTFAAKKPPGEFRIFCLGGSTVQGRPYAKETSFTSFLQLALQAADASRTWRVVNCGGVSYASYRLAPILQEVLRYEPDLIILCTGHNEFLEDRTYAHLKHPGALTRAGQVASRSRTYNLLRQGYLRLRGDSAEGPPPNRPVLPEEVEALLDYRGGLQQYHRDEARRRGVIEHYRYNLSRMAQLCRHAEVPLLLVCPVSNLRDCPPFKSEHRAGLTAEQLQQWQTHWNAARRLYQTNLPEAIEQLRQAASIDGRDAALWYQLGQCHDALGQPDDARRAYWRAVDEDICPLRMIEPLREALLDVAARTHAPLIDAQRLFADASRDGVVGDDQLVDHIHPSIEGHQRLANALADELIRESLLTPSAPWRQDRDRAYEDHLARLDTAYYVEGKRRLDGLRTWAEGRAPVKRPN